MVYFDQSVCVSVPSDHFGARRAIMNSSLTFMYGIRLRINLGDWGSYLITKHSFQKQTRHTRNQHVQLQRSASIRTHKDMIDTFNDANSKNIDQTTLKCCFCRGI